MGLDDHTKDMADELASEGYIVLAADLYNREVATDPNRARELSSSVRENPEQAISNLQSAVQYLASHPNVNSSRIENSKPFIFGILISLALDHKSWGLNFERATRGSLYVLT